MLFNSIEFAIFLPLVFLIYWFVAHRNVRIRNLFLLVASYVFYGWWDWRFLSLIAISSAVDFFVGLRLGVEENEARRRSLLLLSIFVNIGFLGVFKYFNFFVDSLSEILSPLGPSVDQVRLNLVLPVGISFYTFQTLSYSIDVYRRRMKPTRDVVSFFAFVAFFPQLVAGPIERAKSLLPQFYTRRDFKYENAADGLRQILWGLFKKVVIADNCAEVVDSIFENYANQPGSTLFLGAVFFAFQIYGDFSGYSDIAIGAARLFGFELRRNFAFPYFSRDIAEFWRRWHISLSSWFRDYVYIPLGGSREKMPATIRNILIVFLVSGFWHGANWTFIAWGLVNALCFLPLLLMGQNRAHMDTVAKGRILPSVRELLQIASTFVVTCLAWVFFRSESIYSAIHYLVIVLSPTLFTVPTILPQRCMAVLTVLVVAEWLQRDKEHALQIGSLSWPIRWGVYYLMTFLILWCFLKGGPEAFIYFQF